jgi:hypothetical protein
MGDAINEGNCEEEEEEEGGLSSKGETAPEVKKREDL